MVELENAIVVACPEVCIGGVRVESQGSPPDPTTTVMRSPDEMFTF
jgi:hypothetical protein